MSNEAIELESLKADCADALRTIKTLERRNEQLWAKLVQLGTVKVEEKSAASYRFSSRGRTAQIEVRSFTPKLCDVQISVDRATAWKIAADLREWADNLGTEKPHDQ